MARSSGTAERTASVRRSARGWLRALLTLLLVPAFVVAGFVPAANAAGDASLQVVVTAVDADTGVPITTMGWGQHGNRVAFKIGFSCVNAPCENATIKLDPTQLDPNLNYYRLLVQSGFSPSDGDDSISGSATAGYTVSLGDLEAGRAGEVTVIYSLAGRPGDHVASRDGQYNGWAVANFPIGFPIVQRVTANADTAIAPVSDTTDPVIWQNTVPTPSTLISGLPARVETDTDYSYNVYMASGCTHAAYNAVWGRVVSSNQALCASDYQVVHRLPPGVELVAAEDNPTVTGSVATGLILTWDAPAWAARNNAEPGWQSLNSNGAASTPRFVTVRFPRENFAPPGEECNFDVASQTWGTTAALTYISMPGEQGVVKTASHTGPAVTVSCVEPFAKAAADGKLSTFDGTVRPAVDQSLIRVPTAGAPPNEKQWTVTVGNQGNVDGVAIVTDDTLDLADAPVYRIETTPTGASVAWTATNGTTTVSGTSTAPVDAPAGFRFATAVVTSLPLAGPNQYPNQTARTNFTVTYKYRVSSTAPIGERRTNTASAVMTYPSFPELTPVPLTIRPHTIIFTQPFAKGDASKGATGSLVSGEYRQTIPTTGSTANYWFVDVNNRSNVPAVPIVEEPTLRAPGNLPITGIQLRYFNGSAWVRIGATVEYTLDNGATGTIAVAATSGDFTAPAGRSIVGVRIVGDPIEGRNALPERNDATTFRAHFLYSVPPTAQPDAVWTNTATGTLTFPAYPDLDSIEVDTTATARLIPPPVPPTTISATVGRLALPGGATQAGPTTNVTFTVGGSTSGVAATRDITPQYVFVAPAGWHITPGSASFTAGTVPAGVQFSYRTVSIGGVAREEVVATWPAGTVFGENTTLPTMRVVARPGVDVPAGTVSRPDAYIGNSADVQPSDVFTTPFVDAPDLDGDGNTTERFATANNAGAGIQVAAVPSMQVLKEICLPDAAAADGCQWIADPVSPVGVPPNSTSIRYRLTVVNEGNSTLSDIVGYDVLPYVGDTGTSDATAGIARGSTFQEEVSTIGTPTNGATVTFSDSTQPCRPEVATVAGCANDWDSSAAGAQAIRLARSGPLAPGASFSVEYEAAVLDAPSDGAIACNSFAVKATGLATVAEPSPVCATVEETDLSIVAGTPQLQAGRPGIVPFTVTNLGGADSTQATVDVTIPAGLTVTSFTPAGWQCTARNAAGDPVFGTAVGPATLTCRPDSPLLLDQPVALNIPVVPTTTDTIEVEGEVTGQLFDDDLANNEAEIVLTAAPAAGEIGITKDDALTEASPGDQLTYTITVQNPLLFETLSGAVLRDTVPTGTVFVSATQGGTQSAGIVTWNLPAIPGNGTTTVTVTVRVLPTASAEIINTATVTAPDPASPSLTLTGTATDEDALVTDPEITLTKTAAESTYVAAGQPISYTFVLQNTGDVTLTGVEITDPLPGISAIVYTWPGTPGTLNPGQQATATATYSVTQADVNAGQLVNTATASARAPDLTLVQDTSTWTIQSTAQASIAMSKTPSGTVAAAGDVVTYTFRVGNDGNVTLNDVTVTDPLPGLSEIVYDWPHEPGVLQPGEFVLATATYAATQADVDAGEIVNLATSTGTPQVGSPVTAQAGATVPIVRTPALLFDKDGQYAAGTRGAAGEVLEYEFTLVNTGNVTLTGVTIDDPLPGLTPLVYSWPGAPGVLLPGQVATATAEYTVTQADVDGLIGVTNTATATAQAPGDVVVSREDTHTMNTPAVTGIQISKRSVTMPGDAVAGDLIQYSFTVTNLGDLTLHDVTVTDPMPGLSTLEFAWVGEVGVLPPGEFVTVTAWYRLTQADIDAGHVDNTATTQGVDPLGVTASDEDEHITVLRTRSAVTLEKTASGPSTAWRAGDVVTFAFEAVNTGDVTLTSVRIDDPLPGLQAITYDWPADAGVLAPGQRVTATAEYQLTAADVTAGTLRNTATLLTDRDASAEASVVIDSPPPPTSPTSPPTSPPAGGLPVTGGADAGGTLVLATGLLGLGLLVMLARRRRRRRA